MICTCIKAWWPIQNETCGLNQINLYYIVFIYIHIYTHTHTHTKQFVNWKTLCNKNYSVLYLGSSTLGKDYISCWFPYNVWHGTHFILWNSLTKNKSEFHICCSALPTMCWDRVLQCHYIKHKFHMKGPQIKLSLHSWKPAYNWAQNFET